MTFVGQRQFCLCGSLPSLKKKIFFNSININANMSRLDYIHIFSSDFKSY